MIWHGNERSKNRNIMRLNTFALDMLDNVGHVGHFLQPRWHMCMSRRRCLEIGDDFVEERGSWGKCGAVSSFLGCRLSSCLKPFFLVSIASMTFRLKTFWLRCVCCHERSWKHPQVMNPHPRTGQRLWLRMDSVSFVIQNELNWKLCWRQSQGYTSNLDPKPAGWSHADTQRDKHISDNVYMNPLYIYIILNIG